MIYFLFLFIFTLNKCEANDAHSPISADAIVVINKKRCYGIARAHIKSTVACSQFGTTEEDHDPSVSAHTRHRGRQLRGQLLHVNDYGHRVLKGQKAKKHSLQISCLHPVGYLHLSAESISSILLFVVRTLSVRFKYSII